jgi:hypothetical protein
VQDPGEVCDDGSSNGTTICGCQSDCTYTAASTSCSDGEFCNGEETCDGSGVCQSGTPPLVDDGVGCTEDSCDEVNDVVVNTPDDGFCDDVDECTDDICDEVLGCVYTPLPDADQDGICDDLDICPNDNPDDSDGDGICDEDDECPGSDDTVDVDLDGIPDCIDPLIDSDGDGIADDQDQCPGEDDTIDLDQDGIPDCIDPEVNIDADIEVVPEDYDFGNVIFGETSSLQVSIMNTGGSDLTVEDIYLVNSNGVPFDIILNVSLPVEIAPQDAVEVEVAYSPTSLYTVQSDDLVIMSDDPDEGTVPVQLDGRGVLADEPSVAIEHLLQYIDIAVAEGNLWGTKSIKKSSRLARRSTINRDTPKKYKALINMIESTGDLIDKGKIHNACKQFSTIYRLIDGALNPKDLVEGPASNDIALAILEIQYDIGCAFEGECSGNSECALDSLAY